MYQCDTFVTFDMSHIVTFDMTHIVTYDMLLVVICHLSNWSNMTCRMQNFFIPSHLQSDVDK